MFKEIGLSDFEKVRRLFQGHKQYIPVLAIIDGRFPGRIFVDKSQYPEVAIAWAISRWAYIEGNHDWNELAFSLSDLIREIIIPDSLGMNIKWFELYAPNSGEWKGKLDKWLKDFNCKRHYETAYIWDKPAYDRFRTEYSIPVEVALEISDHPILPEHISKTPFVSDSLKSQTAIGCKATVNGKTVAYCRSNGLASDNEFMIDIATSDRSLRGKGYATAAAVGLLDYCFDKRLAPLWETTEDNAASRRLAQKLGFIEAETYPVYRLDPIEV